MKGRLLPLVALIALSGCSIKSLVNQINKESEKIADLNCSCLEGDLQDTCFESASQANIDDDDCTIDALKEDSKASRETLNCILDATKDARKCYEDELDCDNPASALSCLPDVEDCPEFPSSVQEALAECG